MTLKISCRKLCVKQITAPYLAALWWRCPSLHSSTPQRWDTAPLHRQCVASGIAGSHSDSHIAPPEVLSASASLACLPGEADSARDLQSSASMESRLAKSRRNVEYPAVLHISQQTFALQISTLLQLRSVSWLGHFIVSLEPWQWKTGQGEVEHSSLWDVICMVESFGVCSDGPAMRADA